MQSLYFILYLMGKTVVTKAVPYGSLSDCEVISECFDTETRERGCDQVKALKAQEIDAHLYRVRETAKGKCEVGCIFDTVVEEVKCGGE